MKHSLSCLIYYKSNERHFKKTHQIITPRKIPVISPGGRTCERLNSNGKNPGVHRSALRAQIDISIVSLVL